ncbi:hypothetical protein AgCh_003653 [Apium graveolens]
MNTVVPELSHGPDLWSMGRFDELLRRIGLCGWQCRGIGSEWINTVGVYESWLRPVERGISKGQLRGSNTSTFERVRPPIVEAEDKKALDRLRGTRALELVFSEEEKAPPMTDYLELLEAPEIDICERKDKSSCCESSPGSLDCRAVFLHSMHSDLMKVTTVCVMSMVSLIILNVVIYWVFGTSTEDNFIRRYVRALEGWHVFQHYILERVPPAA